MTVSAINTFRLRPGVPVADFEQFSAELDRPVCLAFDEVRGIDGYLSDDGVVVALVLDVVDVELEPASPVSETTA